MLLPQRSGGKLMKTGMSWNGTPVAGPRINGASHLALHNCAAYQGNDIFGSADYQIYAYDIVSADL